MNVTLFLERLREIHRWYEEQNDWIPDGYRERIRFYPFVSDTSRYHLLQKGYWSYLFFAQAIPTIEFGLQMQPGKAYKEWPVYQNFEGELSHLYAPHLGTFIPVLNFCDTYQEKKFSDISANWEQNLKIWEPLIELFEAKPYLNTLKEYAFNPANRPAEDAHTNLMQYRNFWKSLDASEAQELYHGYVEQLNDDSDWLPDALPPENLGIWKPRILTMLASRANSILKDSNVGWTIPFLWEGYIQPHGADFQDVNFYHELNKVSATRNGMELFADTLRIYAPEVDFQQVNHPLYKTLYPLSKAFRKYTGEEHYQAALELEADNKPLEAWNVLVSASYWAGVNGHPDLVAKHWQYAITLCEKQNWTDAHEALTLQWKWFKQYQSSK